MKKLVCLLLMCMALPAFALGVTEGVVEEAEAVDIMVMAESQPVSYLPDPSYYAWEAGYEPNWGASETYVEPEFDGENFYPSAQNPCLTSGEIVRAKRLLEAYQKGEATGDGASVMNATENVVLGVYPLSPEDYDGEAVFVILPNTSISDEWMLAMIDAFHQLGLTFDPEALNGRNCMRGGGIECTRMLTDEESERYSALRDLIRLGKIAGVEPADILHITLDTRYFNGLDGFAFRPYRRMTDEELAGQLVAQGVHDESAEMDFDGIEKQTRELLGKLFSCPLSMELQYIGGDSAYLPMKFDSEGKKYYANEGRAAIAAGYEYPKEGFEMVLVTLQLDQENGRLVNASLTDIPVGWIQTETGRDPAVEDGVYIEAARTFAKEYMFAWIAQPEQLNWVVDNDEPECWTNYGLSVRVSALNEESGEMIEMFVGCGDMQVHTVQLDTDQEGWFEDVEFQTEEDLPVNG